MNDNKDESKIVELNVQCGLDETLEVRHVRKKGRIFSMVMRFNTVENVTEEPDLIDRLSALSRGALALFKAIKDQSNWRTNLATLETGGMTASEMTVRSRLAKELSETGLAKKVKCTELCTSEGVVVNLNKGSFMVNPNVIMPPEPYFTEVLYQWNQLKK